MQKNWGFFLILKKALVKMCFYLGGGGKLEGGRRRFVYISTSSK